MTRHQSSLVSQRAKFQPTILTDGFPNFEDLAGSVTDLTSQWDSVSMWQKQTLIWVLRECVGFRSTWVSDETNCAESLLCNITVLFRCCFRCAICRNRCNGQFTAILRFLAPSNFPTSTKMEPHPPSKSCCFVSRSILVGRKGWTSSSMCFQLRIGQTSPTSYPILPWLNLAVSHPTWVLSHAFSYQSSDANNSA